MLAGGAELQELVTFSAGIGGSRNRAGVDC